MGRYTDARYADPICGCEDPSCAGCDDGGEWLFLKRLREAHRPLPGERRMEVSTQIVPTETLFDGVPRATAEIRISFAYPDPLAVDRIRNALVLHFYPQDNDPTIGIFARDGMVVVTCYRTMAYAVADACAQIVAESA